LETEKLTNSEKLFLQVQDAVLFPQEPGLQLENLSAVILGAPAMRVRLLL
jgi:hypothetical protein